LLLLLRGFALLLLLLLLVLLVLTAASIHSAAAASTAAQHDSVLHCSNGIVDCALPAYDVTLLCVTFIYHVHYLHKSL
jgi:hypothetical protein